ncbi:MAG: HYR domain-containing protein, partial [Saprospiraceae bacterium]
GLTVTLTVVNANFPSSISAEYNFPANWWKPEDWGFNLGQIKCSAKAYAKIFARTYAPTAADCADCRRLVDVLEIGNECWAYDAPTYQAIVDGFLEGFVEYYQSDDSRKIKLIPAAFQAQHEENNLPANPGSSASWKDYLGTRIKSTSKCYLDGVNLHPYSNQLTDNSTFFTQRLLAYPEQLQASGEADSKFLYVKNAWKWVEDNMPAANRNIHITEFGWDTENNDCGNGSRVGVGEFAQGLYIIRSLLNMSRMGVYRAMLFEASDDPKLNNTCQFAYHSSGLWNVDPVAGGAAKLSQKMLLKFMQVVGSQYVNRVVDEDDKGAHAYYLADESGVKNIVAWYAADVNNLTKTQAENLQFSTALNLQVGQLNYVVDENKDWYFLDDQISVGSDGKIAQTTALSTNQKSNIYQNGSFNLTPIPIIIPIILTNPCDDLTAPELTCPNDIVRSETEDGTIVNFPNPNVIDDCDPSPQLTVSHPSGSAFPEGITNVTFTATDAEGRQATCTFSITIQADECNDVQPPQISCPEDVVVLQAGTSTIVDWDLPLVSDDCDPLPIVTSSHQSGDVFPVGSTLIIYYATDAAGNRSECSFTVTVEQENTGEPGEYCAVQTEQPWERWIERVQLLELDNRSGKQASPPVGYGDFTTMTAEVKVGESYNLVLTPSYSWAADPSHDMHWRVWIDYNQDGDFMDPSETIIQAQSNEAVTVPLTILNVAKLGNTRMRISFKNNDYPDACEQFSQGEIEDYTLVILKSS